MRLVGGRVVSVRRGALGWSGWSIEQPPAQRELGAMAVSEETAVPDAVEAVRQGVHQEAAEELAGGKRHHLGFGGLPIILPAEADLASGERDQPPVGDRDAMGVAGEIGEDLARASEGAFGIDHPLGWHQGVENPLDLRVPPAEGGGALLPVRSAQGTVVRSGRHDSCLRHDALRQHRQ